MKIVEEFLTMSRLPQYFCGLWPENITKWAWLLAAINLFLTTVDIQCQQIFVLKNYKNLNYAIGAFATCGPIIFVRIYMG